MKTAVCPACSAKLVGDDPVCPRCGRILASFQNSCYIPAGKKRVLPCAVYITENRLVVRPGDAYMDNFGVAGAISAAAAEKHGKALPELDSPWGEVAEIGYPNGKLGTALNSIKAGCGILITYADGIQIAVGMSKDDAARAAEMMRARLAGRG